jgi:hypothetical protein
VAAPLPGEYEKREDGEDVGGGGEDEEGFHAVTFESHKQYPALVPMNMPHSPSPVWM